MAKFTKEVKNTIVTAMESAETYEALKTTYIEALKEYKTAAAKKFIDACFAKYVDGVKDKHVAMSGKKYTADPNEDTEDFMEMVSALLKMDGIKIEQCGTWLWITGDTKPHRAELKSMGCTFCGQKKAWAKKPSNASKRYKGKKHWSMEKIRDTYGSVAINDPDDVTA